METTLQVQDQDGSRQTIRYSDLDMLEVFTQDQCAEMWAGKVITRGTSRWVNTDALAIHAFSGAS